jgi:hypothetical protein
LPTVRALRRRAQALDLRLWSVRPGTRHWPSYGPYTILDARTAGIVAQGLKQDEVVDFLNLWRDLSLLLVRAHRRGTRR